MNKFLVTLSIFFLFAIGSCDKKEISYGTFTSEDDYRAVLINNGNSFLIETSDKIRIVMPDTISYGTWRKEDDFLVFNSDTSINSRFIDVEVIEYLKENDSLTFIITNPYERNRNSNNYNSDLSDSQKKVDPRFNRNNKEIRYQFSISGAGKLFSNSKKYNLFNPDPFYLEFNNKTSFKVSEDYRLYWFFITPYADPLFNGGDPSYSYLMTKSYSVKNSESNYFEVNIPDLNKDYMHYERFNEEYVKIIDENTIKFEGIIYKRVDE